MSNLNNSFTNNNVKPPVNKNVETSKYAAVSYSQSPLVRLSIDKDEEKPKQNGIIRNNINDDDIFTNQIQGLNLEKRIVSKFVEVTTKIVYTFDDGSTKEVVEKQNHTFSNI